MLSEEKIKEIVQNYTNSDSIEVKKDLIRWYIKDRKNVEITDFEVNIAKPSQVLMFMALNRGIHPMKAMSYNCGDLIDYMYFLAVNWIKENKFKD